ncbi:glutathione S-transferase [Mycena maculata]|uniref:Glutathione S-transferase n=1 Tax=Mycena maculata TaxID=230809 RepID=A0AAD7JHG2_9AGAR|nr:glutathione S-transferase [Mycena maculata]
MATRDTSHLSDISKMKVESDGSFNRLSSVFRDFIQPGGKFAPEKNRYHLYVSYACPWATRTLIVRKLKGLEDIIPVTIVSPRMGNSGWPFAQVDAFPGAEVDPLFNSEHIKDLYLRANPDYDRRFTVPIIWDKKNNTIVNNESSEIIRMFNTAFNDVIPADKAAIDLYPAEHRAEIDAINEWVYPEINNGVYRAGFATTQEAYEKAVKEVFEGLDKVEKILTGKDYLVGGRLTEADVRLWVTIIRFDPVYVGHFKCNFRTIRDGYPAINMSVSVPFSDCLFPTPHYRWMRALYWKNTAFSESTDFDHIKTHYYWSHPQINGTRIVPAGPIPNIQLL